MRLTIDRIILLLLAIFLAAGLSFSELARLRQQTANDALTSKLSETERKADAALKAVIEPRVILEASRSVYLVTKDNNHVGTAFVLDRERGILATAAHVAAELNFDAEETPYTVVNRQSNKALPIKNAKIHSGYFRFRKLVERYQPADPNSTISNPNHIRLYDIAHDGALLFIDPIDAETGENILGPNMVLETEENLAKIGTGDPIAILGYPVDTFTDNLTIESAGSRSERGVIASMIAPIDLVENTGDTRIDNLIIHRMASAPGNSGGPIINTAGHVIGINSHGVSSAHSNGDKLAQRADVLYDLLDPFREQEAIETLYFPEWRKRLAKWPKLADILPEALYQLYNTENGAKPKPDTKLLELEVKEDRPYTSVIYQPSVQNFERRFVLIANDLIAKDDTDSKEKNTSTQTATQRPSFVIEQPGQFADFRLRLSPKKNHVIFAYDYSLAWQTAGACPMQLFYRRDKETLLRATGTHRMPVRYFPANKQEGLATTMNIVVRRNRCDPISNKFMLGIISWDNEDEEAPAGSTANLANSRDFMLLKAATIRNDLQNTVDCNLTALGKRDNCMRAIKVRNFTASED